MTDLDFNAEEIEQFKGFEPLPVGEYCVIISSSEMKPTKNGNGKYLQLVYDVIDESEYNGRKLFDRLNLVNESETAEKIGKSKLSSICHAVGVLHPSNTEELHDIPFFVKVKVKAGSGDYGPSNDITAYVACEEAPKPATKKPVTASAPAKTSAPRKPWERK